MHWRRSEAHRNDLDRLDAALKQIAEAAASSRDDDERGFGFADGLPAGVGAFSRPIGRHYPNATNGAAGLDGRPSPGTSEA